MVVHTKPAESTLRHFLSWRDVCGKRKLGKILDLHATTVSSAATTSNFAAPPSALRSQTCGQNQKAFCQAGMKPPLLQRLTKSPWVELDLEVSEGLETACGTCPDPS